MRSIKAWGKQNFPRRTWRRVVGRIRTRVVGVVMVVVGRKHRYVINAGGGRFLRALWRRMKKVRSPQLTSLRPWSTSIAGLGT